MVSRHCMGPQPIGFELGRVKGRDPLIWIINSVSGTKMSLPPPSFQAMDNPSSVTLPAPQHFSIAGNHQSNPPLDMHIETRIHQTPNQGQDYTRSMSAAPAVMQPTKQRKRHSTCGSCVVSSVLAIQDQASDQSSHL